jgi:hypothetical protein
VYIETLLQKIDAKTLAAKVLPHIQVSLRMGQEYGPQVTVKKSGISGTTFHIAEARCPVGTRVMGGGAEILPIGQLHGKWHGDPFSMGGSGLSVQPPMSPLSIANMGDNNCVNDDNSYQQV